MVWEPPESAHGIAVGGPRGDSHWTVRGIPLHPLKMTNSPGLKLFIFAPAKLGDLDTTDKYHHVMRCCPACGAALVLFHEKFGDLIREGESDVDKKPTDVAHRTSDISGGTDSAKDGSTQTALHGGWYCAQCGVHILPEQKAALAASRARTSSNRLSSRSMEDLKDPAKFHHAAETTSTTSSKGNKLIDDNFDELESHFHQSFMTLMSHIREHFTMKEAQLKEYQVDLCQRERIIRANESHLDQRIATLRQAEVILKEKTDRLALYKDTMISQVEARAQQLARYEKSLSAWRAEMASEFGVPTQNHHRYDSNAYTSQTRTTGGQRPRAKSDFGGQMYGNPTYVTHQQLKQWTSQNQLQDKPEKDRRSVAKYEQDSSVPRQSWTASQLLANPALKSSHSHLPTDSTSYGARANQYSVGNVARTNQNGPYMPQGKPPIQGGGYRRTADPTGRFGPLYNYRGSQEQLGRGRTQTDLSEALSESTNRNGYDSGRERSYTKQSGDSGYTSLHSPASQNVTAALPSDPKSGTADPRNGDVTTSMDANVTSRTAPISGPSNKLNRFSNSHSQLPGSHSGSQQHLAGSLSGSHTYLPGSYSRGPSSPTRRDPPGGPAPTSNGFQPATFRPYTVRHGSRLVTEI